MKATLYEALGIPPAASDEEVRASLRRLIRKYYAKTRDGQGNVEEALRFINHASRILSDPERRAALRPGARGLGGHDRAEDRARRQPRGGGGRRADRRRRAADDRAPQLEASLDAQMDTALVDDPGSERNHHHPGLTERVASFGRSPTATLALCVLFGAFIAAGIMFVTPADAVLVAKQVLVWLTLTLVALAVVYGVVHAVSYMRRRAHALVAGPAAADRSRDPQLAAREERVPRAPTSRRRTRAGSSSCAWPSSSARSRAAPASRGPGTGSRRACSTTRSGASCSRCCCPSCKGMGLVPEELAYCARPSADRADRHHRDVDSDRGAADRRARLDAGQVAVRRLPAVLDLGRVRAARYAGATRPRAAPRVPRLVGRHGVRLPAARADPRRRRLREAHAEPGNRLGLRAGRARHARARPAC